jgi:hypothetical protein
LALCLGGAAAGAQQFEPRPGLAAVGSDATGVFVIGGMDIGETEVTLLAFVHNGRILQVHSRRAGAWLAKRSGSTGGKAIAPTSFDELGAIALGFDTDVRCLPESIRRDFARAADIVPPAERTGCTEREPHLGGSRPLPVSAAPAVRSVAGNCGSINCRTVYAHPSTNNESFRIKLGLEQAVWGFEGYGIVAVWGIPDG